MNQFEGLSDFPVETYDTFWLGWMVNVAYFLAKISNLLKWLEKIKLCVNRVSLACIYVGRTNQKIVAGEENFLQNFEGHGWKMCRRWFARFCRSIFDLEIAFHNYNS